MRGLMGPGGGGGGRGGPRLGAAVGWLAAAGLAALLGAHLSQEVGYWAKVEAQLAEERALRERWAGWGARARAQAAQLAAAAAGEWSAAAEAGCAPCPKCPGKQERSGVAGARKGAGRRDAGAGPAAGGQKGGGRGAGGQTEQAAPAPGGGAGRQAPRSGEANLDFKVWVYPLPAKFHSGLKEEQGRCVHDQYGTEIRIHEELLASPLRTLDPAEAEFFFVPIYGECFIFRAIQQKGSKEGFKEANAFYLEGLRAVREQWPHWNRTQGRDHVFVFAGARGPHIFKDWKQNIRKSVFLTPEGDRSLSEQFNTWKDVVIPGLEFHEQLWSGSLRGAAGPGRDIFAFFRGTIWNKGGKSYSRGLRIRMHEQLKGQADVIFGEPVKECDKECYMRSMARSVFCLCPRGWSPWTLRAYQAMMTGCIPVLIADEIELPYEDSIDWSKMTVKIAEKDANRTLEILRGIAPEVLDAKRSSIDEHWRKVAWQTPSSPGDAFHSVMAELGRKRRAFKASSLVSWT